MTYYVGIDPGPSTGIAIYCVDEMESGWEVFQVSSSGARWLMDEIFRTYAPKVVSVEKFIVSNRPGTKGKDAETTRSLAEYVKFSAGGNVRRIPQVIVRERRAIDVKPWASDKRLTKTDFPWGAKFKDARDAGRHALYAAVQDGWERDPLL